MEGSDNSSLGNGAKLGWVVKVSLSSFRSVAYLAEPIYAAQGGLNENMYMTTITRPLRQRQTFLNASSPSSTNRQYSYSHSTQCRQYVRYE